MDNQTGGEMSEAKFSLIFDGASVANGEIDVQDFAPALLAIGDLIQSANETINGGQSKASVKVHATAKGSFEVDLTIWQNAVESIFAYAEYHKDGIAAATDLADLILKAGTIAGAPAGGLFILLKWLKGRKPEKLEQKDENVVLHIGDNYFITNKNTIRLAEDMTVRQHARRLVSVLEREGIDSISSRRGGDVVVLERNDVKYFEIPDSEEEEIADEVRHVTLQIISLSFKEDNKWRLTDGAEPFSATIEDADFLNKIANNEISFSKNDYLECDVRERQVQTSKGLKKERTIIRVIKHRPAPRQLRLV